MENAYKQTMYILKKYKISANKKLGQNFLIDDDVIQKIVDSAELSQDDLVIEIGPGLGTLTERLLEKSKKVIAIELDNRMIEILEDRFGEFSNFELINNDVLKIDLNEIIEKQKEINKIKSVKIVANLPYYITTPIIMKLLEDKLDIKSITIMIQKEVAKRIAAVPGNKETGAITYAVNYYCEVQEKVIVPNTSFIPAPEVESEVISLKLRKEPPIKVQNKEMFFKVIKASFMQRRKALINGISNSKLVDKDTIKDILQKNGIDQKARGEELSMEQFAKIANEISNMKK